MEINVEERANKARELFMSGYNCAQSVVLAYVDLFDADYDLISKISASFGGGMGRMREVCGTCSGMFMIAGLAIPADNVDKEAKMKNYALVQELAEEFRRENGSIICRELLGLDHKKDDPRPEARTAEYYKKRPCPDLVHLSATIVGNKLKEIL